MAKPQIWCTPGSGNACHSPNAYPISRMCADPTAMEPYFGTPGICELTNSQMTTNSLATETG